MKISEVATKTFEQILPEARIYDVKQFKTLTDSHGIYTGIPANMVTLPRERKGWTAGLGGYARRVLSEVDFEDNVKMFFLYFRNGYKGLEGNVLDLLNSSHVDLVKEKPLFRYSSTHWDYGKHKKIIDYITENLGAPEKDALENLGKLYSEAKSSLEGTEDGLARKLEFLLDKL